MPNTRSQNAAVLAYLQTGATLTHLEAERMFGTTRIAARVNDLRNGELNHKRYDIETVMGKQNGKRFARYRLLSPRLRVIENIAPFPPEKVEQQTKSLFT